MDDKRFDRTKDLLDHVKRQPGQDRRMLLVGYYEVIKVHAVSILILYHETLSR